MLAEGVAELTPFFHWCDTAVRQVRFFWDRGAIAVELTAHYEDHVRDLERIGFDHDLALERALGAMGNAVEVGRALDRVHKPFLGWMWLLSRYGVLISLLVTVCVFGSNLNWFSRFTSPAPRDGQYENGDFFSFSPDSWEHEYSVQVLTGTGDCVVERSGDTWSVPYAVVWKCTYPGDNRDPGFTIYWTVVALARDDQNPFDSPRSDFMEDLVLTCSGGTYYDTRYERIGTDESGKGIWGPSDGRLTVSQTSSDPFRTLYCITFTGPTQEDPPGDWCELSYPYGEPWTIHIDWEEAAS